MYVCIYIYIRVQLQRANKQFRGGSLTGSSLLSLISRGAAVRTGCATGNLWVSSIYTGEGEDRFQVTV